MLFKHQKTTSNCKKWLFSRNSHKNDVFILKWTTWLHNYIMYFLLFYGSWILKIHTLPSNLLIRDIISLFVDLYGIFFNYWIRLLVIFFRSKPASLPKFSVRNISARNIFYSSRAPPQSASQLSAGYLLQKILLIITTIILRCRILNRVFYRVFRTSVFTDCVWSLIQTHKHWRYFMMNFNRKRLIFG